MLENLGNRFQDIFKKIRGHGKLSDSNIKDALREVKMSLLEADVNYKVVKDFTNRISEKAIGTEVIRGVNPAQQFIKLVNDELVELLGGTSSKLTKGLRNPTIIMLAGLQGAGKTTFAAKLAKFLKKQNEKLLLVGVDVYRPAAIKQLQVLGQQIGVDVYSEENSKDVVGIATRAIEKAKELLKNAKKPVLYVGGGVGMAKAVPALREFLAQTQMPSVSTLKGLGAIHPNNDVYMGMIGMHGTKAANFAVQESDLLLVCGARFDDRVTGKLDTFAPHAKVIHCDIDAAEIHKLRRADVALQGDLIQALNALKQDLDIEPWREQIRDLKAKLDFTYVENQGNRPIDPWALLNSLSNRKPNNAVICTDVGQHQMWSAQHMKHFAPENYITSAGFGTMGFGLPAAVGAKKARPQDEVILVTGDGSLMMNIQELGSIKRGNLPVKILLLDNQRLGMVRQWQDLFWNKRRSETILDDNPDFVMLANAFGIPAERIESADDVDAAINRLLNSNTAYLLQVCIPPDECVWPLVPPGACNADMVEEMN